MLKAPRWIGSSLALASVLLLAACGTHDSAILDPVEKPPVDPPGQPTQPTPDDTLVISTIGDLVPGHSVPVQGAHLNLLTSLNVDGQDVAVTLVDSANATFTMPATASCDVDGRSVEIVANGTTHRSGSLMLASTTDLDVGESKILTANELGCLQLNSLDQDYLLSFASFTTDAVTDTLMKLHTIGVTDSTIIAAPPAGVAPAAPFDLAGAPDVTAGDLKAWVSAERPMSAAPSGNEFDSYSTAQVGDIVQMMDYLRSDEVVQAQTRDQVPTYSAKVIAATATQLIVVDQRLPKAADFDAPSVLQAWQDAAERAEQYSILAVRDVVDPDFTLPQGAGGRMISVVTDLAWKGPNIIGTIDLYDLQDVPWASGTAIVLLDMNTGAWPSSIARVITHELAHIAAVLVDIDGKGQMPWSWYSEAIAVTAEDAAARISSGHALSSPVSPMWNGEGVSSSIGGGRPSSGASIESAFWQPGVNKWSAPHGAYDRGARILRYAQQQFRKMRGPGASLHRFLATQAPGSADATLAAWSLETVAAAAGMSATQLLDESMMAELTDDLVPADAAARYGLPQLDFWDNSVAAGQYQHVDHNHFLRRGPQYFLTVTVPAGGFQYFYIRDEPGRGFSMQASELNLQPRDQVRLTRLR